MPVTITSTLGDLSLENKATLAVAVLKMGQASDHETAAFYLKATGKDRDAQVLLLSAGDPAVVLAGFTKPGEAETK